MTAGVTAVGQEELTFLTISKDLADSKSGKLKGKQSWNFALTVPGETAVGEKPKAKAETYRLPPTFSGRMIFLCRRLVVDLLIIERASPAYIDYKLVVTVRRGAFKVNQTYELTRSERRIPRLTVSRCRLTTSFFYLPLTRAEPPSPLRLAAYQNGHALIGPEGDPVGWKVLPPVQVSGTLFSTKPVAIECTVRTNTSLSSNR